MYLATRPGQLRRVLRLGSHRGEFKEREGVALCLIGNPSEDPGRKVRELAPEQGHGIRVGEGRHREFRKTGPLEESPSPGRSEASRLSHMERHRHESVSPPSTVF